MVAVLAATWALMMAARKDEQTAVPTVETKVAPTVVSLEIHWVVMMESSMAVAMVAHSAVSLVGWKDLMKGQRLAEPMVEMTGESKATLLVGRSDALKVETMGYRMVPKTVRG